MNYIGSKLSLLDFLETNIARKTNGGWPLDTHTYNGAFCDLFAGTAIVGRRFKERGFKVIANDIQYYSYCLIWAHIKIHHPLTFATLLEKVPQILDHPAQQASAFEEPVAGMVCRYLNALDPVEGFIYQHYCLGGTRGGEVERLYFTDENGGRTDAIRQTIERWRSSGWITKEEYFYLIACLLEDIDKCANTASVYGAFLKRYKKSALRPLQVVPIPVSTNGCEHEAFNQDANELIGDISCDVLYMDPPYNHRQYATNYHLLETIARYDDPAIYGKTGLRPYGHEKSLYCSRPSACEALKDLVMRAQARHIFLSYNDEGVMHEKDLWDILSLRGKPECFRLKYGRFKADSNRVYKGDSVEEQLYYVAGE